MHCLLVKKTSDEKVTHVSSLLAAKCAKSGKGKEKSKCVMLDKKSSQGCAFLNSASFANCDVNIVVNSGKRVIKNAVLWFNFFCHARDEFIYFC